MTMRMNQDFPADQDSVKLRPAILLVLVLAWFFQISRTTTRTTTRRKPHLEQSSFLFLRSLRSLRLNFRLHASLRLLVLESPHEK